MKSFALFLMFFILAVSLLQAQKIGFNTTAPLHPFHMKQPAGTTLQEEQPLLFAEYTGTNWANMIAIKGKSKPADGFGIGGDFEGGYIGLRSKVLGIEDESNYYGMFSHATGTGDAYYHGVYGFADGLGTNVGLMGNATGGITNWAGFFAGGNVHVQNKLGVGTLTPSTSLHVTQGNLIIQPNQPIARIEYIGSGYSTHVIGLRVRSIPQEGYGIGGDFEGGILGIQGKVSSSTNGNFTGVKGIAYGSTGSAVCKGVFAEAQGPGTNQAIFAFAAGGTNNYSGYFADGKVFIQDKIGIGTENPVHTFELNKPDAIARLTSTNFVNGSSLILRNTSSTQTYVGSILFDSFGAYEGGIYYSSDDHMAFFVNSANRLLINPSGLLGVGRTPITNRLEVEGNASKSSAGDWLANSDERLKKNIVPLDPEEMVEKLLALKGIQYEWNDDKTGTTRPTGTQYGFTAQNIQSVFPELVEEDGNGYLQTAYGTYDAMTIEVLRYLVEEIRVLKERLEE